MLVIVSDLHFCDGTAYATKVEAPAFSMLLCEVGDLAEKNGAKEIDLVFLGDVFDFLRTTAWFTNGTLDIPLSERPWADASALDGATPSANVLRHAHRILDDIEKENAGVLKALRENEIKGIPVRRFYLPGNHDRLCLHDSKLLTRILSILDAKEVGPALHPASNLHAVIHPDYGLLARHGHEWDLWNFERYDRNKVPGQYEAKDYLATPIGDPITTELVAAIPYRIKMGLEASGAFDAAKDPNGPKLLDGIISRLQRIEDVRPTFAAFRWIAYERGRWQKLLSAERAEVLSNVINQAVKDLAKNFLSLPYYKEWHSRHAPFFSGPNGFHWMLKFLSWVDVGRVGAFIDHYEKIGNWLEGVFGSGDPLSDGATKEDLKSVGTFGMRYLVYGHTHESLEVAIRSGSAQDIYLNSGTWRGRQFETEAAGGFIGWEQCTWLAFYKKDEPTNSGRKSPAFESWTGQRKIIDHGTV